MATFIHESASPRVRVLEDGTEVHRTVVWSPPGCHGVGCGMLAYIKDGKIVKIEGDPDHPVTKGRLCVRCLSILDIQYHPDRLLYPIYRDPKDRGKDKWKRISWDEAYDIIEREVKKCKEKYGDNSLIYLSGTGREGGRYMRAISSRVLKTSNECYTLSGFSCMAPRDTVCSCIGGAGYIEYDYANGLPGTYDDPEFVIPKYILMWGRDPLRSNPDGTWGHSIIELMKRGTKLINVDPRMNWLSCRSDYVLQLRPGTDNALAFGLLWVIINEDLYDHEFVEKWVYGFEEFKERVNQYPLDWAAEVTGVDAELIRTVAHCLAEKPWGIYMGLATDQNPNGVSIVHNLYALVAITGNLDIPGGTNLGYPITLDFGQSKFVSKADNLPPPPLTQEQRDSTIGMKKYPIYELLVNKAVPDELLNTLETDEPYPIRFCWIGHTSPITPTNTAQPNRWYEALKKMDFTVATNIFMNPSLMALADLVLPLATFLEHEGYTCPLMGEHPGPVGAMTKVIEPIGECKSEFQIAQELGKRMNPEYFCEPGNKYESIETYINQDLKKVVGFDHDWEELRERVVITRRPDYRKYEKGLLRPDGQPGFNTTTGKIELYCLTFAALGQDPLPVYEEPRFSPYAKPEWTEEYPLILTTGQRHWASFHSEHREVAVLREIKPGPLVEIHPNTAKKYGIKQGDTVVIENPWGKCEMEANLRPILKENVIAADHGWWFPEEEPEEPHLYGVWRANINLLVPHNEIGPFGFGALFKSLPCKIYKKRD